MVGLVLLVLLVLLAGATSPCLAVLVALRPAEVQQVLVGWELESQGQEEQEAEGGGEGGARLALQESGAVDWEQE